jgi:hypothetical protein
MRREIMRASNCRFELAVESLGREVLSGFNFSADIATQLKQFETASSVK